MLTQAQDETRRYLSKVYFVMCLALVVTAVTGWYLSQQVVLLTTLAQAQFVVLLLWLGFAFIISPIIKRVSAPIITILLIVFAVFTGAVISTIFLVYTLGSILATFLVAAGMFAGMSAYGYFTKRDLTKMGQIFVMILIGLIIGGLINFFLKSSMLDYIMSAIGIIIFSGLTAYHTQKIVKNNIVGNEGTLADFREITLGAFQLYLDFINLFLSLLRFFGKRK
jgi:FtsH-binding integral membrane protein